LYIIEYFICGVGSPGSMGPKIQAAIDFVQNSAAAGRKNAWAAIGDLRDAAKIVSNEEGTIIREDESLHNTGVIWRIRQPTKAAVDTTPRLSADAHKSG
jgi:carbamate kinase